MQKNILLLSCLLLSQALLGTDLILGDFETAIWPGLERSPKQTKSGNFSGKWSNLQKNRTIRIPNIPQNWSGFDRLSFWLYSEKANNQTLTLVCDSENPANGKRKWDYYFLHVTVNWQGWKHFNLKLGKDIVATRRPIGWKKINYCSFNAGGWQHEQKPDTVLYFDDVKLIRDVLELKTRQLPSPEVNQQRWELTATNHDDKEQRFRFDKQVGKSPFSISGFPETRLAIGPHQSKTLEIILSASAEAIAKLPPLSRFEIEITGRIDDETTREPTSATISATIPLPQRKHPFLFGDAKCYEKARERAKKLDWAKKSVDKIIADADKILNAELVIPDEGGQWSHHYVCKKCGNRLYRKDGKHVCRKCGQAYTGWPYDQVIIGHIHGGNWRAMRPLGLAYAFTKEEKYAERAREIMLGYAKKYKTYPIHNSRGRKGGSGARIYAQTLDEGVAAVALCRGYDLVWNSPCFSDDDHRNIADNFLREVAATIRRNNAGISNWQSWHNAGIAAIGFCLQDAELASLALKQKRGGFEFQLKSSILPDGFWYEGTAAYHYYALSALKLTSEIAHFAGIDYWGDKRYQSLYEAPLHYTFPDLTFPAINDSDVFSIRGRHDFYELAYIRTGNPDFLTGAQFGKRSSLEALLYGPDELPQPPPAAFASRNFPGLGAIILRSGKTEDQLYAHLDYGPHGGGHGHPDKLALTVFALGKQLAPDPGRLAYAAPQQRTWYTQTFAHNTICVDQKNQKHTTGKLEFSRLSPDFAVATASSSGAYPGILMRRRIAVFAGLLLDVFTVESEKEHTYDYLYHNFGTLTPGIATEPHPEPLGKGAGYQHLENRSQATCDSDWSATFAQADANLRLHVLGTPGTQLYFGTGIANNPPAPCPAAVVRRQTKKTTYIALLEPFKNKPGVSAFRQLKTNDPKAFAFAITHNGEDYTVLLADSEKERSIAGIKTAKRAFFQKGK